METVINFSLNFSEFYEKIRTGVVATEGGSSPLSDDQLDNVVKLANLVRNKKSFAFV